MNGVMYSTTSLVLVAIIAGAVVLLLMYILKLFRTDADVLQNKNEKSAAATKKGDSNKLKNKKKVTEVAAGKKLKKKTSRSAKAIYNHHWLMTTLKGHTEDVLDLDFSSNGKYLASCAKDRTVLIWDIKDFAQKDRRSLRINIDFDYPTFVKWSPDSKAFIIHKFNENTLEVYKVVKKPDGWLAQPTKALTFPNAHLMEVVGMGIASSGRFIMSCSIQNDLRIWDLKGQTLAEVDTYLINTACAKISPCGRFVVATGFAPEAKVWEIMFNKLGEFQEVKRVFELTGHSSGVFDVAFDVDSSHMATVSKDGTWKLFDTKVEYKKGEDARMTMTGQYELVSEQALIALSPNSEVVAIASASNVYLYETFNGTLKYTLGNIYEGDITRVTFDASGAYLLTSGDKQIHVFHNVVGLECEIRKAQLVLKDNPTSATKDRLQKFIAETTSFLDKFNI